MKYSDLFKQIRQRIEFFLEDSGARQDFVEIMRRAISPARVFSEEAQQKSSSKWVLLPCISCQAAGGDAAWAIDIAVAWFLFYLGAHIMDNVEDQDEPDEWWADTGPGAAINAATGLFFTASTALNHLHQDEHTLKYAVEITDAFHKTFMQMGSGQHLELSSSEFSIEQYHQIASAKSGEFFGLACKTGAMLSSQEPTVLDAYYQYGHNLGVMIQMFDDLIDISASRGSVLLDDWKSTRLTLPVIYALNVLPEKDRIKLKDLLMHAEGRQDVSAQAVEIINQCGAVLFVRAEFERYRARAIEALRLTNPAESAYTMLKEIVNQYKL